MNKKAVAYKRLRNLTRGMKVWTWESWVVGTDPENGKPVYDCECRDLWGQKLTRDVFHVASRINRTWLVRIRVKCRTEDGQEYLEETELQARDVKLDDFTELYKQERQATLNACNPKHVIDVGWIAKALD